MLTLYQQGGADFAHPLAMPCLNNFRDYAPDYRSPYVCPETVCTRNKENMNVSKKKF